MFDTLPRTTPEFLNWTWEQIEPYFRDLEARELTAGTLAAWMADWAKIGKHLDESYWRLWAATTQDTLDAEVEARFHTFLAAVREPAETAEQRLRRKLLGSGLTPERFVAPLRNIRAEVELFREANLPLLTEEQRLGGDYDRIRGVQTVEWEGKETTLVELLLVNLDPDRDKRERAWRLSMDRFLQDRDALNHLWIQFTGLRQQIAANAGLPNYRAYRWQQMIRLDYTPENCEQFHDAIEAVVVPAVERVLERRRKQLGIDSVRPWDVECAMPGSIALRPFNTVNELEDKASAILGSIDPQLGVYFETLRQEGLLDLDNRRGKMPSSYCATYPTQQRPFVFMNVVGSHDDVMILFHECGHAFHSFENTRLPYHDQLRVGTEFHEVAAMAMELLAAPYLAEQYGGFYTELEAARARIDHLEGWLRFWPYVAVVDAFQHWAHTHAEAACNPANCDARWAQLWARFMTGEDWSGLDDAMKTGWQRKLHIFRSPFYYIDYGLAQLGAVQIWQRARHDPPGAVAQYRSALALGGTVTLPELFAAAGAKLAFDAGTLGEAVAVIEDTIAELETIAGS